MSFADSLSDTKVSLVSFSADWCGTCQTMVPILELAQGELKDRIAYLEIDIDKNPMIAAAFQIRSVPTLLLFKSGKILWRHAGLISLQELKNQITLHL